MMEKVNENKELLIEKIEVLRKTFEREAKKQWWTAPVSHGAIAYASWDYQVWLEERIVKEKTTLKDFLIWCSRKAKIEIINAGTAIEVEGYAQGEFIPVVSPEKLVDMFLEAKREGKIKSDEGKLK